jgi:hypothetical protein
MSTDGNFKFGSASLPAANSTARTLNHPKDRVCGFCGTSMAAKPAVLLRSGHSVHLECYLQMPKRQSRPRPN